MKKLYRQGDVLLVAVKELPADAKRLRPKRLILAEGEVTGHVHELIGGNVELFEDKKPGTEVAGVIYAKIMAAPELRHAEHSTQVIEPGIYRVVRQREYTAAEIRRVTD